MADTVSVTIPEGSDTSRTWRLTTDGAPLDLSGVTVTAVIKPSPAYEDDDAAAHTLTAGNGLTILDAAEGTVRLDIPTLVTDAPSTWWYKIIPTVSGETEPAIVGWITVTDV
ncbi:hypothetical protein [Microbispora sp. ATCC PTA-5024]|uniref:hypothetical protein n=1 Tax=Microbispora sp. ATCC PTA-5024 TaxID=316330 RepID=UPI0003DC6820|nr:hypothetical protein [Microbispora sp. ATCC PTA-5024]ETK36140.1 hypothetical protein MPTA5024_10975 [Microbispora sp. ATCC PTA-5024]